LGAACRVGFEQYSAAVYVGTTGDVAGVLGRVLTGDGNCGVKVYSA
jgi:hypothetical protein